MANARIDFVTKVVQLHNLHTVIMSVRDGTHTRTFCVFDDFDLNSQLVLVLGSASVGSLDVVSRVLFSCAMLCRGIDTEPVCSIDGNTKICRKENCVDKPVKSPDIKGDLSRSLLSVSATCPVT